MLSWRVVSKWRLVCIVTAACFVFGLGWLYVELCPRSNESLYIPALFRNVPMDPQFRQSDAYRSMNPNEVTFVTSDGVHLRGWFVGSKSADRVVLVSHGMGVNIAGSYLVAKPFFNSKKYAVFMYDYRGYGDSEGKPSLEGICTDGLAAYDYLVNDLHIPARCLVLYGDSLGTGVACYQSVHRSCAGLILSSPFASLRRRALELYPVMGIYPPCLFPLDGFDNTALLKGNHPPLLVIHGTKDALVPKEHGDTVYQEATQPKQLFELPTEGHCDYLWTQPDAFAKITTTFVDSLPSSSKN